MKAERRRILQIIPAEGWWAGYTGFADPDTGTTREGFTRLVCWALVENENGENEVLGMEGDGDTDVTFSVDIHSFDEYLYSPVSDPNAAKK